MTTKEQERKALAQIRKIVAGLGEDSYIATAFEGCFEIAEENIENDFACSLKQRLDSAEHEAEVMRISANDYKAKAERMQASREYEAQKADAEIKALRDQLFKAREKAISQNLYRDLWLHFDAEIESNTKRLAGLADTMAQLADHPNDIAFANAVQNYRKCKESKEKAETILACLELYDPEKK
ncbi:MAG: hypothetical protein J6Y20_03540 [Lachnospiraceae bacterium]|nr:hypothetical protein [Lachnospiraceae bacterium]